MPEHQALLFPAAAVGDIDLGREVAMLVPVEDYGDTDSAAFMLRRLTSSLPDVRRTLFVDCMQTMTEGLHAALKDRFLSGVASRLLGEFGHCSNPTRYVDLALELARAEVDVIFLHQYDGWGATDLREIKALVSAMQNVAVEQHGLKARRYCSVVFGVDPNWLARIPQAKWPSAMASMIKLPVLSADQVGEVLGGMDGLAGSVGMYLQTEEAKRIRNVLNTRTKGRLSLVLRIGALINAISPDSARPTPAAMSAAVEASLQRLATRASVVGAQQTDATRFDNRIRRTLFLSGSFSQRRAISRSSNLSGLR